MVVVVSSFNLTWPSAWRGDTGIIKSQSDHHHRPDRGSLLYALIAGLAWLTHVCLMRALPKIQLMRRIIEINLILGNNSTDPSILHTNTHTTSKRPEKLWVPQPQRRRIYFKKFHFSIIILFIFTIFHSHVHTFISVCLCIYIEFIYISILLVFRH